MVMTSCVHMDGKAVHFRQSHSTQFRKALEASTRRSSLAWLDLSMIYERVYAWMPELNNYLIMHILSFGAIVLVHLAYIARGLFRLAKRAYPVPPTPSHCKFTPHMIQLTTAQGVCARQQMVGTIRITIRDDEGDLHQYDIPGVVYDPDSPHSLIGIPFLAKNFASDDETSDRGTWIKSGDEESQLSWDHEKYTRHFGHPASELPEMQVNEGTAYFQAFCSRMKQAMSDRVHFAFSSAFSVDPLPALVTGTKAPRPSPLPPAQDKDFELGQSIVFNDGADKIGAVICEGASEGGMVHTVRHKDGHKSVVHDHHLTHQHQMSMTNIPATPLDYCKEVGKSLSKEEAQRLARPRTLSPIQQELMSWHHRLYHLPFHKIFQLAKIRFLPKRLLQARDAIPLCPANLAQRTDGHDDPRVKSQGLFARKLIPQISGFLTSKRFWGCTTFVDHVSDFVYVHLMRDFTLEETLLAKAAWEKILIQANRKVKHYHVDNGRFTDNGFIDACNDKDQTLTFCGVGAHHQNGIIENKNKILTQGARTLLLHGMRMWPQMVDSMLWPFAFKAMAERLNSLQVNLDGSTAESVLYGLQPQEIPVKTFHMLFCPVYVLDSRLHSTGGAGPPKWEPRSRIGVYLGHSPFHAGSVALVFNPATGR
ncbi:LOW QUALITY PROTEIN: hypothetical protein ACHAWF_014538, partial [Thalassiosira exigua]